MTCKCSSSAAGRRIDKIASIKRIAVIAALVLLLSMAVVGAGAAEGEWDGSKATSFAGGSGSQEDPYKIATCAQLAYLAEQVNSGTSYEGEYFLVTNDLDLNNIEWTPIGNSTTNTFNGILSGLYDSDKSHVISNLKITTNNDGNGLFGYCSGEFQITYLKFENCSVSGGKGTGILIGYVANASNAVVSDIETDGCIVSGSSYSGGLVGVAGSRSTITYSRCYVHNGSVNADIGSMCGGMIGICVAKNEGGDGVIVSVDTCIVEEEYVHGSSYVGGFEGISSDGGNSDRIFTNCTVKSCVVIGGSTVGGFTGHGASGGTSSFTFCEVFNTYVLSNGDDTGGLIGANTGTCTASNCKVSCSTIVGTTSIGGILGNPYNGSMSITNATVEHNNIQGTSNVGGLCGGSATSTGGSQDYNNVSGTGGSNVSGYTNQTSVANQYITADGLTVSNISGNTVTFSITGQRGAGVSYDDETKLVNGGMNWQYTYPDSETETVNFDTKYSYTTTGTFQPKVHLYNQSNTIGDTLTVGESEKFTFYSVTYDANGGSGTVPETQYAKANTTVTVKGNINSMTKDGYWFAGWKINNEGITYLGGTTNTTFPITGNVTLYAQWAAEYTELEYIESTGTQWIDTGWYLPEDKDNFSLIADFEDTGTQLGNWRVICGVYLGTSGSKQYYCVQFGVSEAPNSVYVFNGDIRTTSPNEIHWSITPHTRNIVKVDYANGNTIGTINGGQEINAAISISQRGEYPVFLFANDNNESCYNPVSKTTSKIKMYGWSVSIDNILERNFIPCKTSSGEVGMYDTVEGKFYGNASGSGSFTGGYKVTYHRNGDDVTGTVPGEQVAACGSSVTVSAGTSLSKTGYLFGGWNTKADGSGTDYAAEGTYDGSTGNVTLYAKWVGHVTYDANGATSGTVPEDTTGHAAGTSVTVKDNTGTPVLSKTGYYFAGWQTEPNGGTFYPVGSTFTMPVGNVTLYVKWVSDSVTYTFTIPAAVTLDSSNKSPADYAITIKTPGDSEDTRKVVLRLNDSVNYDSTHNTFRVKNLYSSDNYVNYTITKQGSNPVVKGDVIVSIDANHAALDPAEQTLEYALDGDVLFAGTYQDTLTFTVAVEKPVTSVTLNKETTTIAKGGNETLTATVIPGDATITDVSWSTSNPAVATVDTNGKVTGVAEGTAVITATAIDGSGKTATCDVTVTAPE